MRSLLRIVVLAAVVAVPMLLTGCCGSCGCGGCPFKCGSPCSQSHYYGNSYYGDSTEYYYGNNNSGPDARAANWDLYAD